MTDSLARSNGLDYVPFDDEDREDDEEVDITGDSEEEESLRWLNRVSVCTTNMRVGFLGTPIPQVFPLSIDKDSLSSRWPLWEFDIAGVEEPLDCLYVNGACMLKPHAPLANSLYCGSFVLIEVLEGLRLSWEALVWKKNMGTKKIIRKML